jgi:hypothetical protein
VRGLLKAERVSHSLLLSCLVLYIGLRFDLSLSEFKDSVQLKPFTPKYIRRDLVTLQRVCIDYKAKNPLPSWNFPEVALASGYSWEGRPVAYSTGRVELPVGAVIPASAVVHSDRTRADDQWYRLATGKGGQSFRGYIVAVTENDMHRLSDQAAKQDQPPEKLAASSEMLAGRGPRDNVMSSDWVTPLLDSIDQFESVLVKIIGPLGSGKSHNAALLSALASFRLHRPVLYLSCKKLQKSTPKMVGILGEIDALFRRAGESEKAIVILDDLDVLSPNLLGDGEGSASARMHSANPMAIDQSKLIADRLSHLFESLSSQCQKRIALVATCSCADAINPLLLQSISSPVIQVNVPVLSADDRVQLLKKLIEQYNKGCTISFDKADVAQRTEAFLPCDLEKLSLRLSRKFQTSHIEVSIHESLISELDGFVPLSHMVASRREGDAGMCWSDIGGLFSVKENLESIVRHPILYRRIYERAQIRLPRGLLLYGPPGELLCYTGFVTFDEQLLLLLNISIFFTLRVWKIDIGPCARKILQLSNSYMQRSRGSRQIYRGIRGKGS